ncbi:hypothetical protein [Pandoraea sputorum]|uniref:Uncharacterized protein n=1 Tax=Pandoraea sputorum TaxID=93222 RepID=A0A5E5BF19_9BURK|nr:hypothetical protein [Pandoraea sputorum]VVE84489.1 hypothetical protein PSP31121_04788 [Pandoraea sputorum]
MTVRQGTSADEASHGPGALTENLHGQIREAEKTLHTELGVLTKRLKALPGAALNLTNLDRCQERLAAETQGGGEPTLEMLTQTAEALKELRQDIQGMQAKLEPSLLRSMLTHVGTLLGFTLALTASLVLIAGGLSGAIPSVLAGLGAAGAFGGSLGFLVAEHSATQREHDQDVMTRDLDALESAISLLATKSTNGRVAIESATALTAIGPAIASTTEPETKSAIESTKRHVQDELERQRCAEIGAQTKAHVCDGLSKEAQSVLHADLLGNSHDLPLSEAAIGAALQADPSERSVKRTLMHALFAGELSFRSDLATKGYAALRRALELEAESAAVRPNLASHTTDVNSDTRPVTSVPPANGGSGASSGPIRKLTTREAATPPLTQVPAKESLLSAWRDVQGCLELRADAHEFKNASSLTSAQDAERLKHKNETARRRVSKHAPRDGQAGSGIARESGAPLSRGTGAELVGDTTAATRALETTAFKALHTRVAPLFTDPAFVTLWDHFNVFFPDDTHGTAIVHLAAVVAPDSSRTTKLDNFAALKTLAGRPEAKNTFGVIRDQGKETHLRIGRSFRIALPPESPQSSVDALRTRVEPVLSNPAVVAHWARVESLFPDSQKDTAKVHFGVVVDHQWPREMRLEGFATLKRLAGKFEDALVTKGPKGAETGFRFGRKLEIPLKPESPEAAVDALRTCVKPVLDDPAFGALWWSLQVFFVDATPSEQETARDHVAVLVAPEFGRRQKLESFEKLKKLAGKFEHVFEVQGEKGKETIRIGRTFATAVPPEDPKPTLPEVDDTHRSVGVWHHIAPFFAEHIKDTAQGLLDAVQSPGTDRLTKIEKFGQLRELVPAYSAAFLVTVDDKGKEIGFGVQGTNWKIDLPPEDLPVTGDASDGVQTPVTFWDKLTSWW